MRISMINNQVNSSKRRNLAFGTKYMVSRDTCDTFIRRLEMIVTISREQGLTRKSMTPTTLRDGGLVALKNILTKMLVHNSKPKHIKDSEKIIKEFDFVFKQKDEKNGRSILIDYGLPELIANKIDLYKKKDFSNLFIVATDNNNSSRSLRFEKLFNIKDTYLNEMYGEVSDLEREIYTLSHKLKPNS